MGVLDFFSNGGGTATATRGGGLLDRLCRENGWGIDEREGDVIALYFNGDRTTPRRTVLIHHAAGENFMVFNCPSRAAFSHTVPDGLMAAMLMRNHSVGIGGWTATVNGGTVTLKLEYTALANAVDAANFKLICSMLVKEVAEIEASLQGKGLL